MSAHQTDGLSNPLARAERWGSVAASAEVIPVPVTGRLDPGDEQAAARGQVAGPAHREILNGHIVGEVKLPGRFAITGIDPAAASGLPHDRCQWQQHDNAQPDRRGAHSQ